MIKKRTCKIVNFAVPGDHKVNFLKIEKKDKYLGIKKTGS